MYDTVILILKKEDIGDKYKWQAILQNIYQTCEYKKVEGGCGYTGGLRVSVTDKRIRIEGSLSKYYYGNNIRSLTLEHTKEALKRLRRELNVPMDKADVVEVDKLLKRNFLRQQIAYSNLYFQITNFFRNT